MGSSHSVPKEGGERLSDYLRREFKGKGFDTDTLVVIALKEEQKQQQDKRKRKSLWKQFTGRLCKRSDDKQDKNTKSNPTNRTSVESTLQSVADMPSKIVENNDNDIQLNIVTKNGSPSGKSCIHIDKDPIANSREKVHVEDDDKEQQGGKCVQRRYLQKDNTPVYQFKVPLKYDFRMSNSNIRGVRDMINGKQPDWANKDYGSEPWDDNSNDQSEECPQGQGSPAEEIEEIPKSTYQQVGGWSDETAYRVRGIVAEELANLTEMLNADTKAHSTSLSILNNAHETACRVRNRNANQINLRKDKAKEEHGLNMIGNSASSEKISQEEASISNGNKMQDTAGFIDRTAQDAACQTETTVDDENNLDEKNLSKEMNSDNRRVEDTSNLADTNKVNKNMVVDNVNVTSLSYYVRHDKAMSYIAGILAAGAAYSAGNRNDVQRAAYLSGVRAVDAAYRMANETANSIEGIRVVDSTKPVKREIEVETAAYLAGIRAVEDAYRKAEETAYMNGVKDAKEAIHSTGKVSEIWMENTTDTSLCSGQKLEKTHTIGQTRTQLITDNKLDMKTEDIYDRSDQTFWQKCTDSNVTIIEADSQLTAAINTNTASTSIKIRGSDIADKASKENNVANKISSEINLSKVGKGDTPNRKGETMHSSGFGVLDIGNRNKSETTMATTDNKNDNYVDDKGNDYLEKKTGSANMSGVQSKSFSIAAINEKQTENKLNNIKQQVKKTKTSENNEQPFSNNTASAEISLKEIVTSRRSSVHEMECAFEGFCSAEKKIQTKVENTSKPKDSSISNDEQVDLQCDHHKGISSREREKVADTYVNTDLENSVLKQQENKVCAFFVSLDSQVTNKMEMVGDAEKYLNTTNVKGSPFIDMATFDEMPIKKAEALLRPPGEETEFAPTDISRKPQVNEFQKKITDKQTNTFTTDIQHMSERPDTKDKKEANDNKVEKRETKSKPGAAEAFFISFDSPTLDKKRLNKGAREETRDICADKNKPFIDKATFDDLPIKKANTTLRPFGTNEENGYMGMGLKENADVLSKSSSAKTKVKRLVRKTLQYGSVEHNNSIQCDNVMRKEKIESATTKVDSWKTAIDDNKDSKPNSRPQKLVAKKDQYGSVAHNKQIKEGNELQKKKIESIKSSLDTWKAKEKEITKGSAQYGSVQHNNLIKLDNAMRKKRLGEIHSNIDTWNASNPGSKYSLQRKNEWETVRDPGKYGSVAHFHQIKRENAKRQQRMINVQSSIDTWNTPNPGSMYSLKRKDDWTPVYDTRKYGSVAHYQQVKQINDNNKHKVKAASSKISTWQSKGKMNLMNTNNQKRTGPNNFNALNPASISKDYSFIDRQGFSTQRNDNKIPSWSRYVSISNIEECERNEEHMCNRYLQARKNQNFNTYNISSNQHSDNEADKALFDIGKNKQFNFHENRFPDGLGEACSLSFDTEQKRRYREINPLTTAESYNPSWGIDNTHEQSQENARSWSRPVSCRSKRGRQSLIPVSKENPIRKYEEMLQDLVHQRNELKNQAFKRWSPREQD